MKTARPLELRIAANINLDGDHWMWTGGLTEDGYGRIHANGGTRLAHRVVYQHLIGDIPVGLQLDHLCRVHACVNPAHLEPVTLQENLRRGVHRNAGKTSCIRGHRFDEVNTYFHPDGTRKCRACLRARWHQLKAA